MSRGCRSHRQPSVTVKVDFPFSLSEALTLDINYIYVSQDKFDEQHPFDEQQQQHQQQYGNSNKIPIASFPMPCDTTTIKQNKFCTNNTLLIVSPGLAIHLIL